MNVHAVVRIDLSRLKERCQHVLSGLRGVDMANPVRKAVKQWAARYRAFLHDRFDRASKGGGGWPALAQSTIAKRRKGQSSKKEKAARASMRGASSSLMRTEDGGLKSAGGSFAILADTGTLKTAFDATWKAGRGQVEDHVPDGVIVGIGGPGGSKKRNSKGQIVAGKPTIADIALWHHEGSGNLPKRTLIEDPPEDLQSRMAGDMQRAVDQVMEGGAA